MLEKLNFNDLLRYGFSGGAFLLAFALTRVGFDSAIPSGGLAESTGLALVAVVIGSLIYCLHCAYFQYPIAFLMKWIHDWKFPDYRLLIVDNYVRDTQRWN